MSERGHDQNFNLFIIIIFFCGWGGGIKVFVSYHHICFWAMMFIKSIEIAQDGLIHRILYFVYRFQVKWK